MPIAALSKRTPEIAAVVLALILALAVMLDFKLRDQNEWIAHTLEVEILAQRLRGRDVCRRKRSARVHDFK